MLKYAVAILLFSAPAFAQQPQPSTPLEQALGAKLVAEINAGLQCSATQTVLQQQLQQATAKVADLEKQLAAAKEPPK